MRRRRSVADQTCPHCRAVCDTHRSADGSDVQPMKGDFSLCAYCGYTLVFTDDGGFRLPTEDDEIDDDTARQLTLARTILRQIREGR